MTHNKNPTPFHHPTATPEFTQTQLHKPSYKSNPATNPATKFTHNTQNKSIPRINQKLQDLTHNKSNQNLHKPSYKSILSLQTRNTQNRRCKPDLEIATIPRRSDFPVSPPRRTHDPCQKSPSWERDVMRERSRCGERAVGEREEWKEKQRERESQKTGNRKII